MEPCVYVIGTVFIDFKGFARSKYNPPGRNLGEIRIIHGGVGRNVAENLAAMGLPVTFISTVDKTALGAEIIARLEQRKVDTSLIRQAERDGMGMWLAILDEKGELAGSISKMPDLKMLKQFLLAGGTEVLKKASHIALELDLNSRITRTVIGLARQMGKPVYGIPGNLDVILKNKEILPELECFICNDIEAGQISGEDLAGLSIEQLMESLAKSFFVKHKCARHAVVTLGARGAIYYDAANNLTGYQPAIPTRVVDTTGAGDAFFSGTVAALIRNRPLCEAVVYGTEAAAQVIGSSENICRAIG